jgi:tRNA threonylcarbamoyladenosine biosynthesis protein TsaE
MKYISRNETDTQKLAKKISKTLRGGEIILLSGDLGAGKTAFVKGLAKALSITDIVKSPTFNLMKCYSLPKRHALNAIRHLCHIDAYRLTNAADLLDIGAEEYLGQPNVITAIEWPEQVKNIEKLSGKIIKIKIFHGKSENERTIQYE